MDKRQRVQTNSIRAAIIVLERHLPKVADLDEVRRLGKDVTGGLARVTAAELEQVKAQHARTGKSGEMEQTKRALRTQHLIRIARRARLLFKHDSRILRALTVPEKHSSSAEHVKAAVAMYRALRPHVAFCHAEGMRRGFLTDLRAAGERLRLMANESTAARLALSRSTRNLKVALTETRDELRVIDGELRAVVQSHAFDGSEHARALQHALMHWSDATKLKKPGGRPRKRKNRRDDSAPPTS